MPLFNCTRKFLQAALEFTCLRDGITIRPLGLFCCLTSSKLKTEASPKAFYLECLHSTSAYLHSLETKVRWTNCLFTCRQNGFGVHLTHKHESLLALISLCLPSATCFSWCVTYKSLRSSPNLQGSIVARAPSFQNFKHINLTLLMS